MADILQIYQYQTVDFTDTSTGALPLTRVWSFPGGTPTTSTTNPENVQYLVPGTYNVTLTETDAFGTTKSLVQTNIIQVSPSSLTSGISGPSPASVKMDEGYQLDDASTGTPFAPTSWAWSLPYGRSATTQNVGVTGYGDWNTLTGTYSGAPGSTYTGNIALTSSVTISGFTLNSNSATTVEVSKLGPTENLYLNATGSSPSQYVTGLSGGLVVYPGNIPAIGSDFGYPADSNLVIKLDYRLRGFGNNANLYFHSTNETGSVNMSTGLWSPNFDDIINGFLIIQGLIYTQFSAVPVDPAISAGNYIVAGQSPDIFLIDESGLFLNLYTNYNYSPDLLSYLIVNPYKIIFSGNIQYINQSGAPGTPMTFIDTGGGSNSNPVVYSPAALAALGIGGTAYTVNIYIIHANIPYSATVTFGSVGQTGNDPVTGNYYVAQDNSNGLGFVTRLNNAIASSGVPSGTGSLEFKANSTFSILNGTGYDPSGFNGVSLEIKTPAVSLVRIDDNSAALSTPIVTIAPFLGNYFNPQGSTETCTGMFSMGPPGITGDFINIAPYYNDLVFGGSIF